MHTKLVNKVRLFFTGFSMGVADLVPGVSGGTVAFLMGVYDELLYSIRVVTGPVLRLIMRGKIKQAIRTIPFGFLLPLVGGMFMAIFGMVAVVTYLLDRYPALIWSLFFGLVLGSAYVVSRRITTWNRNRILLLLGGAIVTFIVVGLPVLSISSSPFVLFFTGAIAICAMILPGISGSLIMVILGQYENVLRAVEERAVGLLISFALGAILGLALFSRLLGWLLRHHHSATLAFLIGVLLGSLRKVWPWQLEVSTGLSRTILPPNILDFVGALILACIGFFIVWRLEQWGVAREHVDIESKQYKKELAAQED